MALKEYIEKAKEYFNLGEEEETSTPSRPQPQVVQSQVKSQSTLQAVHKPVSQESDVNYERKTSRQSENLNNNKRASSQQRQTAPASSIIPTIAIKEPAAYDNIMESARIVRNGESVLVNFKNMGDQQARRSIDFLTGVVFTLDGDIQNVGGQIFLLTPNGMTVDAEKEMSILSGRNFEGMDNFQ
ncbi:MAG: cell division protein SepF [Lactococcus plantarum]|nr:cell division protein SepF [Lactococcus plantarum]MDN6084670.1 cell division protein SepF [Lactococcus plantarum]